MNELLGLLIARAVASNVASRIAIQHFSKTAPSSTSILHGRQLLIIVPVYEEVALIRQTVAYYQALLTGVQCAYLVIVGNCQERDGEGRNPTLDAAVDQAAGWSRCHVVEFGGHGGKAHQVNFAVRAFCQDPPSTWLVIYDVDSRITQEGLREIFWCVNEGIVIAQQHAIFFKNFDSLSFLQRCQAVYQSRWTVSHELLRLRFASTRWPFWSHLVGHGLICNASSYFDWGGLPVDTEIEDVAFGFLVFASGTSVHSMHTLELADTPNTFIAGVQQAYTWSCGSMRQLTYLRLFRELLPASWREHRVRATVMAADGYCKFAIWLLTSYVFSLVVISAFVVPLALLWLLAYSYEAAAVAKFLKHKAALRLPYVALAAMSMLFLIWASMAPTIAFARSLAGLPNRRVRTTHK